jgi:hypothetical protein
MGGDPSGRVERRPMNLAVLCLRLGIGIVWLANLVYIVNPANAFFPTFGATANSYGPTTLTGPAIATFVAANPLLFSVTIALVTAYLAFAFLLGISVRLACVVGAGFNLLLLLTQFATLTTFPGGTDVGPQPLYLVAYVALFISDGGPLWSLELTLSRALGRQGIRPSPSDGRPIPSR